MRRLLGSLICLSISCAPAAAQLGGDGLQPDPERVLLPVSRNITIGLPGSWRLFGGLVTGTSVWAEDPEVGAVTPTEKLVESRLRLRPALYLFTRGLFRMWRVAHDVELHVTLGDPQAPDGLAADERWRFRADQPVIRVTQLSVQALGEHLMLTAGLVRSHFGFGLLANAGEDAPDGLSHVSPFGVGRHGDRVLRGQVAVLPLGFEVDAAGEKPRAPLAVTLAVDAIIDDDSAEWFEGDRALQILLGAFGQLQRGGFGGGLAHRRQTHADGGRTTVNIGLLSASAWHPLPVGRLFGELEAAGYVGETDFVQSAIRAGDFTILSAGGAARLGLEAQGWLALVEAGFASGDANPFDDTLRAFTVDRDYRVGLLLFSEALRSTTAVTAHNVADPRFRGRPPRGYDNLASGGSITNARYLNPRASLEALEGLTLHAGYLFAMTDEPYADPYRSGLAGGQAVGPRGALDARVLGHELDVGVAWAPGWRPATARLRLQAAWLRPGEVFEDADGGAADDVLGAFLQVEGRW